MDSPKPSQKNEESVQFVCPESTIESANRRNFIKKAVLASAAVGVSGVLVEKSLSVLPESSAESVGSATGNKNASHGVTTDTYCSNSSGNLAVFDDKSDVTGAERNYPAYLSGRVCGNSTLTVTNTGCYACGCVCDCCSYNPPVGIRAISCRGIAFCGSSLCGTGVSGVTGLSCCHMGTCPGVRGASNASGPGVSGISLLGSGVCGIATCGSGVNGSSYSGPGVSAQSSKSVAIRGSTPFCTIARFANTGTGKNKTAGIEIQNGCSTPAVWLEGVAGQGNSHGLTDGQFFVQNCKPRVVVNTCGKVGIGTLAPNATLQVNGGVSVGTKVETSNYTMSGSDYVVLVDASLKAINVILPPASNTGQMVVIKKIDGSSNKVTIERQGSDTIEGATSKSLPSEYNSLTLIASGIGIWYILSTAT